MDTLDDVIGIKEVPMETEEEEGDETGETEAEGRVGVPAVRKKMLGGLGKLKDYSKRSKELSNPYAPTEVS